MSQLKKSGSTRAWRKIRERTLKRDKGLCVECLALGHVRVATEVDHITRREDGGTDEMSNLDSLCTECHRAKTKKENGSKTIACDVNGYPMDPSHHWNAA